MIYKYNGVEYKVPDGEVLHLKQTTYLRALRVFKVKFQVLQSVTVSVTAKLEV